MARTRETGPYVWVTWASKLLAGDASCEWASWFKAQHDGNSWARMLCSTSRNSTRYKRTDDKEETMAETVRVKVTKPRGQRPERGLQQASQQY